MFIFMSPAAFPSIVLIVSTRCIGWILGLAFAMPPSCVARFSYVNSLSRKLDQLSSPDLKDILIGR